MFDLTLRKALEQALSLQHNKEVQIYDFNSVAGGCINYTARIGTSLGQFFVKLNDADLYPEMFDKEVKGLELLASTGTIRIPEVINHGVAQERSFLMLEYIQPSSRNENFWRDFGRAIAELHKNSGERFGLDHDNYIGSLKQLNNPSEDWVDFFIQERLQRQVTLARNNGYISKEHVKKFDRLYPELENIFPKEAPALLHGDLWSGNFMVADDGEACIFDPAVYYGHREAELAFTALFGGFDLDFYEGYNEVYPLKDNFELRKDLYNLYPLLVHVNLFGASYLSSVESILNRYAYISS